MSPNSLICVLFSYRTHRNILNYDFSQVRNVLYHKGFRLCLTSNHFCVRFVDFNDYTILHYDTLYQGTLTNLMPYRITSVRYYHCLTVPHHPITQCCHSLIIQLFYYCSQLVHTQLPNSGTTSNDDVIKGNV